jgi:hypothetical protein
MDYKEEIRFLETVETKSKQNDRIKLNDNEIALLKNKHRNIPVDYLDYLKHIGWGSFRENQFMVYKNLAKLSDIGIETENEKNSNILFFGDNFSGDLSGFDLAKNGDVIEYWHDSGEIYETETSFKAYIKEQMLMDSNGNDLRKSENQVKEIDTQ